MKPDKQILIEAIIMCVIIVSVMVPGIGII